MISKSKWQIMLIKKSFDLVLLVKYQPHHNGEDLFFFSAGVFGQDSYLIPRAGTRQQFQVATHTLNNP